MKREQSSETKYRRLNSWQSQPYFDKMLQDVDISGLTYLVRKYEKEMNNYYESHNLSDDDNFSEYKGIQQRYKMVNEELEKRALDIWASPTYYRTTLQFDSNTGTVYDSDGNLYKTADFNETETGYIIRDLEGTVLETHDDSDNNINIELTREDNYNGWKYWNDEKVSEL